MSISRRDGRFSPRRLLTARDTRAFVARREASPPLTWPLWLLAQSCGAAFPDAHRAECRGLVAGRACSTAQGTLQAQYFVLSGECPEPEFSS